MAPGHSIIRTIGLACIALLVLHQIANYIQYTPPIATEVPLTSASEREYDYSPTQTYQSEDLDIQKPTLSTSIPVTNNLTPIGSGESHHAYDLETIVPDAAIEVFSRIAKVTMVYWKNATVNTDAYEKGLLSHRQHNALHKYKHFVLRREAIKGTWSKNAYMMRLLIQELEKPVSERLDWLFWHDADVMMLNNQLPLEVFLPPPTNEYRHVNLILSNDKGGLNDGTFFVRVCEWSVYLFANGLSVPYFQPKIGLAHGEQSAMAYLVAGDWETFGKHVVHVPQHWFNSYHDFGADLGLPPEWDIDNKYIKEGDLLIHFPGSEADLRTQLMNEWWDRTQLEPEVWSIPFNKTRCYKEIAKFWENDALDEQERDIEHRRRRQIMDSIGGKIDDKRRVREADIRKEWKFNSTDEEIDKQIEREMKDWDAHKMEAFRNEEEARLNGSKEDNYYDF
jgi:hypothetical protein